MEHSSMIANISDAVYFTTDDENFTNGSEVLDFHLPGGNSSWVSVEPVPKAVEALMYIMYIVISVAAIGGNVIVCYIVFAYQRMRSVTNFFIVNLAVGDILMACLCIPFGFVSNLLLQYWPFGAIMCVVVSYAQAVSVFISAYTLVAISFDRYIAILYPLRPRMTKFQAKLIIALVWLVALLTPLPTAIMSKLDQPQEWIDLNLTDRYTCTEAWESPTQRYYYSMALMVLQYFFPLAVLIYTYTRIAVVVWGKRTPGEAQDARDQRMAASKRKMIKMMIVCVCVFTLCWLPFNSLMVIGDQYPELYNLPNVIYLWFACHWLAMSHACYNPAIYCWMNEKYRHGFRMVFRWLPCVDAAPGVRMCQQSTMNASVATGISLKKTCTKVDVSGNSVNRAWDQTEQILNNMSEGLSYTLCDYCTIATLFEYENFRDFNYTMMIKMMITVVSVFTLCWLPLNALIVAGDEHDSIWQYPNIHYIWFVCHWLAMSNASYNPIIYCWMNSKYREGFRHVFYKVFCLTGEDHRFKGSLHRNGLHRYTNNTVYTSIRSTGFQRGSQSSSHRGSFRNQKQQHNRTESLLIRGEQNEKFSQNLNGHSKNCLDSPV